MPVSLFLRLLPFAKPEVTNYERKDGLRFNKASGKYDPIKRYWFIFFIYLLFTFSKKTKEEKVIIDWLVTSNKNNKTAKSM